MSFPALENCYLTGLEFRFSIVVVVLAKEVIGEIRCAIFKSLKSSSYFVIINFSETTRVLLNFIKLNCSNVAPKDLNILKISSYFR